MRPLGIVLRGRFICHGIQQFSISASFTPKKECKRINKTIPSREYTKRYHLKLPLFTSLFTAVASSGH